MWEQAISEVRKGNVERACELFGSIFSKRQGNGWAAGPPFLRKSCKKAVKFIISRLFVVDLIGIEPTTLRMRTVRSPSWAIGPYLVILYIFARFVCAVCCPDRARVMLRLLSQLSYRPILAVFQSKKLWKTDSWDIQFWGVSPENRTAELEGNLSRGMCLHMDANVVRSQGGKFSAHGLRCMVCKNRW